MMFQPHGIPTTASNSSSISDNIEIFNYTQLSYLEINSDSDLEGLSLPGNGSDTNPYILSNNNFTGNSNNLLSIINTSKHIVISDNIFDGLSSEQTAISLQNVSNIHIFNNSISDLAVGISANFTGNYNILIDNNTISNLYSDVVAAGISLNGWFNISSISDNSLEHIYSEDYSVGIKLNSSQPSLINRIELNAIRDLDGSKSQGISIYSFWSGILKVDKILDNHLSVIESSKSSTGIYLEHIQEDYFNNIRHGSYVDISLMQYNTFISINSDGSSTGVYHSFNVRVISVLENSFSYITGSGYFYGNLNYNSETAYISMTNMKGNYFSNNNQGLALSYIISRDDLTQNIEISENLFADNNFGITIHSEHDEDGGGTVIEGLIQIQENTIIGSQSYGFSMKDSSTGYLSGVYFTDFLIFHNNFIDNNPTGHSQVFEGSQYGLDVRFNYYSDHSLIDVDPQDYIIDIPYPFDAVFDRKDRFPTSILNPNDITFNPSPIISSHENYFVVDLAQQTGLSIQWNKELGYNLNPFTFNIVVKYPDESDWVEITQNLTSSSFNWNLEGAKLGYNHIKIIAVEDYTGSVVESEELIIEIIDSSIIEIDSQTLTEFQIYGIVGLSVIVFAIIILYIRNKRLRTDIAIQKDPKLKQAKLKEYAKKGKDIIERDEN